ncbi:MAG: alpha/beta fold hydrolase [Gammaproteobacteria bacterium]
MAPPVELAYERFGDGPPVVILHGLFGSKRNWRTVAQRLGENYAVVTVDLRNHGDSPHASRMDYTAMAEDIGELFDLLDLNDVDLIGHSMGGKAAMTYALSGGARIGRLIIVDIAPQAYPNEYGAILRGLEDLDLVAIARRADADAALSSSIPDPVIRQFILQNLTLTGDGPAWRFNLGALVSHIEALVGAIPVAANATFNRPTCLIRGAHSDRALDPDRDAMAKLFPALTTVTIPAAGHWPHSENPAEFLRELSTILASR